METIIVGVDGSESAAGALRWAQREAQLRTAQLTAVMAWGLLDQHHPDPSIPFNPHYGPDDARAALHAYVTDALGAVTGVHLKTRNDIPDQTLLAMSENASLLVLGGRGLGGFKGMLLGAVSYKCLHQARCPVAIVRGNHAHLDGEPERIVVGYDGSDTSRAAVAWAVEEARTRHAHLHVIHCWNAYYGGADAYGLAAIDPTMYERPAQDLLDHALDGIDTAGLTEDIDRSLVCDNAPHAVLEAAKGADLIVLGSRGVGGFEGLLVGSTTAQVVHHASCPVVVLPQRDLR